MTDGPLPAGRGLLYNHVMITDLTRLTIANALELIEQDSLSHQELTEACYRQIERLNPILNAFITIIPEAQQATVESEERPDYPIQNYLAGIPLAVKDLFETAGIRTTAGSKFFADYVPPEDAFVIRRLKQAGTIILGKTNTHEIALGVTTNNPHYGACRNPWNTARIPGGSSGGSAVAVATGMALGALGTDTGGSIRIPAALTGVVGLKPTYGRVSLRGVFPLSWNLDHVGPLAKSVRDAALLFQVLANYDAEDPACIRMLTGDYLGHLDNGFKGRKFALAVGEFINNAEAEVLDAVHKAAEVFESLGAVIEEVNTDWLREAALANALMTQADGAAFHRERMQTHPEMFGEDVRQRLETGARFTSSEYALARRKQVEIRRRCERFFESYDILLLPTTPITAPEIEGRNAIEEAKRLTRFTAPFNLAGIPALSMPCGFSQEGLPIGLQIVGPPWNEARVLRVAHAYEQSTAWHERRPEI